MGISVFICPVPTAQALDAAIRAVVEHNCAEMKKLGVYSDEEFARLDPMRSAVNTAIKDGLDAHGHGEIKGLMNLGCQERWTRGENIKMDGCIVAFEGQPWLEVVNQGGGACTSIWLKTNHPACGWIGTEGKPPGFKEAPMVIDADNFSVLRKRHAEYVS